VKKIGLILLTVVMAMGALGVGYALWWDDLFVDVYVDTGELDWEFYNHQFEAGYPTLPTFTPDDQGIDPGWTKDVGWTDHAWFDTDGDLDWDKLEVYVHNAYPGYYNHVSTWVHVNGSVPIIIVGAWVSFDGGAEVFLPIGAWTTSPDGAYKVSFGNNYGYQFHYCQSWDISFDFMLLQPALQEHQYSFSIRYVAVQYNEYVPGMYVPPAP